MDAEAERILARAGWEPGRQVDISAWRSRLEEDGFVMHHAAERFLREFGDLVVPYGGPGISRAREALEFDPLLAIGEGDRFAEWSETVGKSICPIGELDQGRFFLGIDEDGMIYLMSDSLARFGAGDAGIASLVLGVMPVPLAELQVLRADSTAELELSGTRPELRALGRFLRAGRGRRGLLENREPSPYSRSLSELQFQETPGSVIRILVDGSSLKIFGGRAALDLLADDIEDFASNADASDHLHVEYFPGHHYLVSGSDSLVIAIAAPAS
ncbi:SUKH-3 domain-containing protein [Herbidospora solisilvae]|uniref:SUKH-3 domain-containing protein n=1 Tax=Herbidospora solisilvae TaxID=2696284 RepID=UPI00192A00F2|nr:SUKH-3 domain-containing protein [Herbidospora solisilvae]